MKTTVLLVGHGSRHIAGNDEINEFSTQWQLKNPQLKIETCFIEFADVLLDPGLDNAARDAERVVVVPLILNAAGHVNSEIPYHIQQAHQRHPKVQFVYARHIGANDSIFAILQRNLRKTLAKMAMPDPKTTGVILLARGSSDRKANGEIAKMARWLFETTDHELIDVAYTGITHPRLESMVQRQATLGMRQIAVLPYYLYTGTLIERIKVQVERLQNQYPEIAFARSDYFGFEPEIYQLLSERVDEALTQEISGIKPVMITSDECHYRPLPQGEHHHHQHVHQDAKL